MFFCTKGGSLAACHIHLCTEALSHACSTTILPGGVSSSTSKLSLVVTGCAAFICREDEGNNNRRGSRGSASDGRASKSVGNKSSGSKGTGSKGSGSRGVNKVSKRPHQPMGLLMAGCSLGGSSAKDAQDLSCMAPSRVSLLCTSCLSQTQKE